MQFVKETSPHIRRKDSLMWMLLNVIIALLPVVIWAAVAYPMPMLRIYPLALVTCVLCEFIFILITKKSVKEFKIENILSALITGMIYALCLPTELGFASGTGYFVVVAGAAIGIILGKLVFGGLGNNIFNPAALGMIVVRLFWGGISGNSADPSIFVDPSISAGATSLQTALPATNLLDLFLGRVPGALGETFHIAILVGMVYLLITKTIDWKVLVSYLGSFIVLTLVAGLILQIKGGDNVCYYALYQLLSGGVLFGAVYMITDPVTGPVGDPARVLFGAFAGVITVIIRLFAGTEGVGFSILFANMIAPALNYPQWSSSRWKKWHYIAGGALAGVALLAVILPLALK
ncbi:MAG: RnfABCDGE type electron transport complex subunit D [Bacilli bacterium]|nr:RnfABCDGE type electron transport complex subunit D [Bacilli bacterium]